MVSEVERIILNLARKFNDLNDDDPLKINGTAQLLDKLYEMGLISHKSTLEVANKITASSFCRRRLPCMMVKNKMSERVKVSTQFIEQGHVRIGTELILDPAYFVTRSMEDYVTWVDSSKIKQHILEYNDMKDDFEGV
ncbi:unnamed protein product [Gordionus sp. m RMFG-2023]